MPKQITTGYARMWPREVFDVKEGRALFAKKLDFLVQPGVYVLYRDDTPYYVGQASRLRRRLWNHATQPDTRYYQFWNFFSAFVVEDPDQRNELEGILIAAMPTANSANPKLDREKMPADVCDLLRRIRQHHAMAAVAGKS